MKFLSRSMNIIDWPHQLTLSLRIQGCNISPLLQNCHQLSWSARRFLRIYSCPILSCCFRMPDYPLVSISGIFLLPCCARLLSFVFLFDFLLFLHQVFFWALSSCPEPRCFAWFLHFTWIKVFGWRGGNFRRLNIFLLRNLLRRRDSPSPRLIFILSPTEKNQKSKKPWVRRSS